MPMIKVALGDSYKGDVNSLLIALSEIVPAGLNSKMGRLNPGWVEFDVSQTQTHGFNKTSAVISISACYFSDRASNINKRTKEIKDALKYLFDSETFSVWIELPIAGFASDAGDGELDKSIDMSMTSAKLRAAQKIAKNGQHLG